MFGIILGFDSSKIYVENKKGVADTNYIGYHVVFPEPDHKIVGEIIGIDAKQIIIQLIGEITNGKFSNGVLKKPSMNSTARIIFKSELESILGSQNYLAKENLLFGTSPIYKDYVITSSLNNFFANHFAIIGNTGSGKSCGLARLIQNVFFTSSNEVPVNAHLCLFDVYGEYYNTFNEMNRFPGLHFKKLTTQQEFGSDSLLTIPAYFLEADDLAILLGATGADQIPVLAKAIDLVKVFKSKDQKAVEYKNDIIARTLLDILSSGKSSTQIRDQVISVLSSYNTETLNLNSLIRQPGYDRTLRQCLNIDDQGKINAMNLVIEYLQRQTKVDIDKVPMDPDLTYTLSDLYYALEFALINEGAFTSESSFDRNNVLKSRLQSIINSSEAKFFEFNDYISKADFVEQFFSTTDTKEPCQLVDVNLSFLDDRFAKSLTKIFSKLFFTYTTVLENRGSYPIHIILEEAHRYVQNDKDIEVIGYNIFDRITKEGRKYGTILGFITQRPNELSKTALSQCSNFVVFKLFYPDDLEIVRGISSNVTDESIEKIKTLHPGMGLVFGTAFKVPLLVNFPLPNPMPVSTSIRIDNTWYTNK
ncbi:MAG TPA: DUF87 domain-containing protein [Bacilli bacterium]|jgi:hypothetical protein|nr:DUF87 domain-containing protein [Bacilli bacterium]